MEYNNMTEEERQFMLAKEAERQKKLEKADAAFNRFKQKYKW